MTSQTGRDTLDALCAQLRAARLRCGMTQVRLAAMLGVTPSALREWESGRDNPTMAHLLRWCRLVGFRLAVFETATGAECRPVLVAAMGESWEQFEIRRLARALREQRVERRITLLCLAGTLEISRTSIKRWEQAKPPPPRPRGLMCWAATLYCSIRLVAIHPEQRLSDDPLA